MEIPTHRRDRTVYVNNIAKNTTEDDLFTLFQRAGPIEKVIFKNADGTPQHALIVFRRIESVMFCLDNIDYFMLKGQALGIRPLRESRLTTKAPKVPHSAGFEFAKQQFFNFDSDAVQQMEAKMQQFNFGAEPETCLSPSTPSWANAADPSTPSSPFLQPTLFGSPHPHHFRQGNHQHHHRSSSCRFNVPPPLQLPQTQTIRQIWVPADQRDAFAEPFTAPPFSAPPTRFTYPGQPRQLDEFHNL